VDKEAMDVTISVVEVRRVTLAMEPKTSDLGDVSGLARLRLPNVMGRGESLTMDFTRGFMGSARERSLAMAKELMSSSLGHLAFIARASWSAEPLSWRRLHERSWSADMTVLASPFTWLQHRLSMGSALRMVEPLDIRRASSGVTVASISALEECGPSLKTYVINEATVDTRDDRVLPSSGLLATLGHEMAFGPQNSSVVTGTRALFSLFNAQATVHFPLGGDTCLSLAARVASLVNEGPSFTSFDAPRFCGPLSCRGWARAAASTAAAPRTLAAASARLSRALPLLRGDHWLRRNVRGHLFLDYGALGTTSTGWQRSLLVGSPNLRGASIGAGVAVRLGEHGRAELNYCVPISVLGGVCNQQGLQFGIGVNYL